VPNGLHVIRTGLLEKLLEVISGLLCLVLEIMLSSRDKLLIRVANILIVVTLIVAGSDRVIP
jgi:hypothetical protein